MYYVVLTQYRAVLLLEVFMNYLQHIVSFTYTFIQTQSGTVISHRILHTSTYHTDIIIYGTSTRTCTMML